MLNRYWRSFPLFIQIIQLIALILVLTSFFTLVMGPLLVQTMGVSMENIRDLNGNSSVKTIWGALIFQFFSAAGIFLLPSLLFAYFTHPRPARYLGFHKPAKALHWVLPAVIILAAAPLLSAIAGWLSQLDLGGNFRETQERNDRFMAGFLSIKSPFQLMLTFIVMALLPGFSEELFFRGIIMRFVAKRTYKPMIPVVVSSLFFASMHTNIYGLPSIFFAGMLLGSFYYLTGSLWPGIIAHSCFNGAQILLAYFDNSEATKNIVPDSEVPASWIIAGSLIAAGAFYLLWKNRTPLKPTWVSDYDPEEIMNGTQ